MASFLLMLNSAAIGITLIVVFVLLVKKSRFPPNQYLLAGLLLSFMTGLLKNYFLLDEDLIEPLYFLYRVSIPPLLLTAPLIYLLVRNVINGTSLRRSDAWFALPAFIQMVDLMPVYLLEADVKRHLLTLTTKDPMGAFALVDGLFIPGEWLLPIRVIYSLPLTMMALRIYWNRRREMDDFANSSKSLTWLGIFSVFVVLFTILNTLNLGFYAMSVPDADSAWWFDAKLSLYFNISTGMMIAIFLSTLVFMNPEILFVLQMQGVSRLLDLVQLRNVIDELDALFDSDPIYLNRQLRLVDVARRLDVDIQTLSKSLNSVLGTNFNTYVNRWRVDHARKRLDRAEHERITIGAISEASGFASRSSFYQAFKMVLGKTPSEYVKGLEESRKSL